MGAALAAVIAVIEANPALIALGQSAVQGVVKLVQDAYALHQAGVLTDDQLTAVWAAVGVDVQQADDGWKAAEAARKGTAL